MRIVSLVFDITLKRHKWGVALVVETISRVFILDIALKRDQRSITLILEPVSHVFVVCISFLDVSLIIRVLKVVSREKKAKNCKKIRTRSTHGPSSSPSSSISTSSSRSPCWT